MTTFDTLNPISATLVIVAGDVRITAGDAGTTTVTVEPTDAANDEDRKSAEMTRVECADGRLLVKQPKLRSWLSRDTGGSIDVTVALPAGSDVSADAALADFTADGPLGEARFKTGLGSIHLASVATLKARAGLGDVVVEHVTGDADVTTGSGELRLRAVDGAAVIKNSNGDSWLGTVSGDLRVRAANGRIDIEQARGSVVAKAANGDVRLGEAVRGSVVLETSLGDVELGIPDGTSAYLDVRAGAGRVHNELEAAAGPEPSSERVEVRARTSAGDVVIRRP
jgi:DUF4097 and DUF4098 domain-containing protein YvlB